MKSTKNQSKVFKFKTYQEFTATSFHNMPAHTCNHHMKAFFFSMNEINYIKLAQKKILLVFPKRSPKISNTIQICLAVEVGLSKEEVRNCRDQTNRGQNEHTNISINSYRTNAVDMPFVKQ